jgi:outer membrane protein insertion porin family
VNGTQQQLEWRAGGARRRPRVGAAALFCEVLSLCAVAALCAAALSGSAAALQGDPAGPPGPQVGPQLGPQPGPPAPAVAPDVVEILLEGNRRVTESQVLAAFAQPLGRPYDESGVDRGVKRLWDTFGLRAQVVVEAAPGGVLLRLIVTEMPFDFAPRFAGNERVEVEKLLEWAGLEPGSELYRFQVPRVRRALEDGYRREGYHFATVRDVVREDTGDGVVDVVFAIDEGPLVCVEELVIEGNRSLPERGFLWFREGLRAAARPQLRAPFFFGLFGTPFDEQVLDEDLIALRQAYRDQGFLNAVVELERLEFDRSREWVTIHLRVDEGERFEVSSLRIEGWEWVRSGEGGGLQARPTDLLVPETELLELCELEPGQRYSQLLIDRDETRLRDRFGELGHVAHPSMPRIDRWEFLPPELVYDLEQFLRDVILSGNRHTRDRVIRRLITVQPGDVADLPQIQRSLSRITGTGYFSRRFQALTHREPYFQFEETGDPGWKDLHYFVEEGDLISIDFAVQYGADEGAAARIDLRFSNFDASRWPAWNEPFGDIYEGRAFRGAGQTVQMVAQPGTEESQYSVSFTEPDIFQRHYDRIGTTVSFGRNLRAFSSHDERRDFWSVNFFRQLTADTSVSLGIRSDLVEVDDLDTGGEPSIGDPLGVPQLLADQLGESRFTGLTLGVRHSQLDRPIQPEKGFSLGADLTFYDELLGSDAEWADLSGRYDHHGRLDEQGADFGWRFRARGAVAVPYGDSENLPYTERYFLGGSNLLRGFALRGVGPIDDNFAIGGETYLASSIDLFYPLIQSPIPGTLEDRDVLRIGVFTDVGVLGPESFELDLDDTRISAGFTFGFVVPIPITLSFGFPLRSEEEDLDRVFSLSFFL